MRTAIQILSLLFFSALFVLASGPLPDWLPADLYLRLDPLLGLGAILARKEFLARALWGLILILLTLGIGRFFCGYACPLGAVLDFADPLFSSGRARRKGGSGNWRRAKLVMLVVFIGAALAGVSFFYLLDPISLLTRFYTFFLYPLAVTGINLLLDLLRPLCRALGWVRLSHLYYPQPAFYMALPTLLIFAGIVLLNRFAPRFWCRYLCPLGALLGLLSPFGLYRRRVEDGCDGCRKCQPACPMGAIETDPERSRPAECLQCRTCARLCPREAVAFPAGRPFQWSGPAGIDLSRRSLVSGLAAGLILALATDRNPSSALQGKRRLIRPPGAIPEWAFLGTCARCGECMRSCPTNTLQPSLWESGPAGLWTPKMELRFAPCEQNCNLCGRLCPTQAIRSLSLEEKTHPKVGTAVLRKELCLVWAEDKLCLICDEICPYNAIVFRPVEGYRRPVVIPSRCNGCGFCEQRCPVQGESAITVGPQGEIRLAAGSYKREAEKLKLKFKPDPGDDRFVVGNPS